MTNDTHSYHLAIIRKLLLAAFTAEELRRFCQDRPTFRPILDRFGPGIGFDDMVARTIDYCESRSLFSRLLDEVKENNPSQFTRFESELVSTVPQPFDTYAQASAAFNRHIRLREFQTLVEERTRRFVGREFVFKAIEDHLQDPTFPSGYIEILGEPGIGKTALMAQLIKREGYMHHFNIAAQNIRSPADFLANICAQLIIRYELEHHTLPPEASQNSGFLSQLLGEVAEKLQERPAVILVDALDEAEDVGLSPGANCLYLPPTLPEGVFFVVTTRPAPDLRLRVDRCKELYLDDKDPRNLDDVRDYILGFLGEHRAPMVTRIKEWEITEDEFLQVLIDLSEGNFMYLVYVLSDIRDGQLDAASVSDVYKLPRGLRGYYQQHWRSMREIDMDRFDRYYEPVVCILATALEPVTLGQVAGWAKLPPMRVKAVIDDWHEFLNVDRQDDGELSYRIYHASFQDFLRVEVGLEKYHGIIAGDALSKIPGFFHGTSG